MRIHRVTKTMIFILADCLFSWMSWLGSIYVFSYLFKVEQVLISVLNKNLHLLITPCVILFLIFGVYRSLWQHPGIGSVLRISAAVGLSSFSFYVSLRFIQGYWQNPGIGMMAFYFFLTFTLLFRLAPRIYSTCKAYIERLTNSAPAPLPESPLRTLIIGAGETASQFLLTKGHGRVVLGLLDNDHRKHGYSLHGVRILGDDGKIPQLCAELGIDEIIICVPTLNNDDLRRIVRLVPARRCRVRLLRRFDDASSPNLREIDIGDLLGRPETILESKEVSIWLKGKTILVTGGGGSIGSEICRQLLRLSAEKIIVFDISENNAYNLKEELVIEMGQKARYRVVTRIGSVQDERRLEEVFSEFKPHVVFHAAAYKHVPLMEECPELAVENNVFGTVTTAKCALKHHVERFVMISTDKAVNPTNVMGASKRMAELAVLSKNSGNGNAHITNSKSTEFVCVRFGNVLGSNGSVIPLFKRQIESGGPVTVTHPDIIRYFMTISEAACLVIEAGAMAKGGEIFILDMGSPVKITDLAENLIRMAGLVPGVDIKIEYIGLRPGEKLYEELLLGEEGLEKTMNDKIFVAHPIPPSPDHVNMAISNLRTALTENRDIREALHAAIPEYYPIKTRNTPSSPNHINKTE